MNFPNAAKALLSSSLVLSSLAGSISIVRADSAPVSTTSSVDNSIRDAKKTGNGLCGTGVQGGNQMQEPNNSHQGDSPVDSTLSPQSMSGCNTTTTTSNSNSESAAKAAAAQYLSSNPTASANDLSSHLQAIGFAPSIATSVANNSSNAATTGPQSQQTGINAGNDNSVNNHTTRVDARVDGRDFGTAAKVDAGQDMIESYIVIAECDPITGKMKFRIEKVFVSSNSQIVKNQGINFSIFGSVGIGAHNASAKTSSLAEQNAKFARISSALGQIAYYQQGQAATTFVAIKYLAIAAGLSPAEASEIATAAKAAGDNYTQKALSCALPSREVPQTPSVSILTPPTPQRVRKGAGNFDLTPSQLKEVFEKSVKTSSF